jgi:hypothetical protein
VIATAKDSTDHQPKRPIRVVDLQARVANKAAWLHVNVELDPSEAEVQAVWFLRERALTDAGHPPRHGEVRRSA